MHPSLLLLFVLLTFLHASPSSSHRISSSSSSSLSPSSSLLPLTTSFHIERIVLQRAIRNEELRTGDSNKSNDSSDNALRNVTQYESRRYELGVFSVELKKDEASEIQIREFDAASSPLSSSFSHGLTRLICRSSGLLFESYPPARRHRTASHITTHATGVSAKELAEKRRRKRMRAQRTPEQQRRAAAGMSVDDEEVDEQEDDDESDSPPATTQHYGPPIFLVPLHGAEIDASASDDDDTESTHTIYRLLRASLPASPTRLSFALLLSYSYSSDSPLYTSAISRRILHPSVIQKSGCTIKFLQAKMQMHKMRGVDRNGGVYVSVNNDRSEMEWTGDVEFTAESKLGEDDEIADDEEADQAVDPLTSPEVQDTTWNILRPYFTASTDDNTTEHSMDSWPSSSSSHPSPSSSSSSRDCTDDSPPLSFLESDTSLYGTVGSQTRATVAGVLTPVIGAVEGTFDSVVGGFIQNAAKEFLPAGIADGVVQQITRQLPPLIAKGLITPLGKSIAESLPPATVTKIKKYAPHGISYKTSHDIVEELSRNIVINTQALVEAETPWNLAILHSRLVPPLLTRSITLSTVAALTHSLSHSPLHDSFCMICRDKKKMCEYCHFTEEKAKQNIYYAVYYSTYYSAYYIEYFTSLLPQERVRAIEAEQSATQERMRYRRIYSTEGQESMMSNLRRGEPDENTSKPPAKAATKKKGGGKK